MIFACSRWTDRTDRTDRPFRASRSLLAYLYDNRFFLRHYYLVFALNLYYDRCLVRGNNFDHLPHLYAARLFVSPCYCSQDFHLALDVILPQTVRVGKYQVP